ncbi:MAG: hypothetical protein IK007_03500 [Lachnospiraceae bacterium]|nr:hypothetical protein [Lachnospiraceae bacterium]
MDPVNNSQFIKEQKCPNCGGTVRFVPEKGKLVCEFCDTEFEIKSESTNYDHSSVNGIINGFDFRKFYEGVPKDDSQSLPIYYCKSCGAEVIAASEEASLTCPYCSNKIVLSDKVAGNMRPNGIIPFKIAKADLKKHLDKFYEDKKLLPKNFFSESKMEMVTGVYVPFWLFNGTIYGKYNYTGKKVRSHVSGDLRITETETYDVFRSGGVAFKDIPLDASEKIDDALMDSILPYDFSEVKDFNYQYLAGFAADRFDVPGRSLQERAQKRMELTAKNKVNAMVSSQYTSIALNNYTLQANDIDVRYILLPVYFFSIKSGDTDYKFAVNGQTGKVVGELPIDEKASRHYMLKKAAIPAAVVALYYILSYFLGWRV